MDIFSSTPLLPALMTVAEKRGGERGDNLSAVAFTLLPADAALDGRSGFIDSHTLAGFLPSLSSQPDVFEGFPVLAWETQAPGWAADSSRAVTVRSGRLGT